MKFSRSGKILLTVLFVVAVTGSAVVWYIFNEKFTDTNEREAHFTVNASEFINEFIKDPAQANAKYAEKIITVKGFVSETEPADTSINIKMADSATGAYIIFAFQKQDMEDARQMKEGDLVKIKGSCSGGHYSEILETHSIAFKRCALAN